jgi:addiction module RelE/StbE family toxin
MKVRFNRGALADISEILDYIKERNPRAASGLASRFESAAALIEAMPEIGAKTKLIQFRRLVMDDYLMVYEIRNDEAIIHYVRHGARKRPWEDD